MPEKPLKCLNHLPYPKKNMIIWSRVYPHIKWIHSYHDNLENCSYRLQ